MSIIAYSLKNIYINLRKRRVFALALVASQMAAILSVYISVGFINNSLKSKQEAAHDQLHFSIRFYDVYDEKIPQTAPLWSEAKGKLFELYDFIGDDLNSLDIIGGGDSKECGLYTWIPQSGNTHTVGPKNSCYASDSCKKGDVFKVFDTEYTVIDVSPTKPNIVINFDDYPDKARVSSFNITLNNAISHERIKEISAKISEIFPENKELSEPEPTTLLTIQIDNMFIFTSAFILLIAVVNISVYFSFLFRKREKQTAIMKICGAYNRNIFLISLTEMLGSYIVSLLFSLIIFKSLLPGLSEKYKGFELFNNRKYIFIFAVTYFLVSAATSVMLSYKYSSSSPIDSYKRAQKGGV